MYTPTGHRCHSATRRARALGADLYPPLGVGQANRLPISREIAQNMTRTIRSTAERETGGHRGSERGVGVLPRSLSPCARCVEPTMTECRTAPLQNELGCTLPLPGPTRLGTPGRCAHRAQHPPSPSESTLAGDLHGSRDRAQPAPLTHPAPSPAAPPPIRGHHSASVGPMPYPTSQPERPTKSGVNETGAAHSRRSSTKTYSHFLRRVRNAQIDHAMTYDFSMDQRFVSVPVASRLAR